jgi:exodeoxyribonuclease VII large subunit
MSSASDKILSITQLTRRIKSMLEGELGVVWLSGEISNWKRAASGHVYFTLKDENAQIDAVMFKGKLSRLKFEPEVGLEVLAQGQITVYERRGNYQIIVSDMQPKGVGALQLAFEKLKKKLAAEGLFDDQHKRPLPMLPKRIGVVTSPTGAAIRDILNVLTRRYGGIHVILHPARVQGDGAAAEIAAGIRALDDWGVDVMIVGRGGGSLEDLWPFNEEVVVRAVYEARTPVISAVGHEVDVALTDFVADLRAPTPSAAAELVVKEQSALGEQVTRLQKRLGQGMERQLTQVRHRLQMAQGNYVMQRPEELIRQRRQTTDELRMRLEDSTSELLRDAQSRINRAAHSLTLLSPANQLERSRERLARLRQRLEAKGDDTAESGRNRLRPLVAQLDALSPLAILSRGYAVGWKEPEHSLVRDAVDLKEKDEIYVRFGAGAVRATVDQVEEVKNG